MRKNLAKVCVLALLISLIFISSPLVRVESKLLDWKMEYSISQEFYWVVTAARAVCVVAIICLCMGIVFPGKIWNVPALFAAIGAIVACGFAAAKWIDRLNEILSKLGELSSELESLSWIDVLRIMGEMPQDVLSIGVTRPFWALAISALVSLACAGALIKLPDDEEKGTYREIFSDIKESIVFGFNYWILGIKEWMRVELLVYLMADVCGVVAAFFVCRSMVALEVNAIVTAVAGIATAGGLALVIAYGYCLLAGRKKAVTVG